MGSQTEIREVQSVSGMDCRTAESMVTRFIDHSLSVNELEEFLDHIETCPSCYDELETYFIVHEAMQQLDEKEDGTVLDFKKLLEQEIRRSRRSIRQTRGIRFTVGLISMAAAVALCVFVIDRWTQHTEPRFLWASGSDQFRGETYRRGLWIFEYPFPHS